MIIIQVEKSNQRLDRYIAETLTNSRSTVKQWFDAALITVNDGLQKPSYLVSIGDTIRINLEDIISQDNDERPSLLFLYEDNDILVLNKPTNLVVHPPAPHVSLIEYLHNMGIIFETSETNQRAGIVHRLDRYTSGIMVLGKTVKAQNLLMEQFKQRLVLKEYIAMVKGNVVDDEYVIDRPILKTSAMRKGTIDPKGKPSQTRVKVLRRFQTKTLIHLQLLTGRTHQIRIHLASKGHPLIGDGVYGKSNQTNEGPLLQAYKLGFNHPVNHQRIHFTVPPRKEFKIEEITTDLLT